MLRRRPTQFAFGIAATAAASQLGHLISYGVRFGPRSLAIESQGAHAYLPSLTFGLAGVVGSAALALLLMLAVARLVVGQGLGYRESERVRTADVLPLLFVLQLAIYSSQETIETFLSGTEPASVVSLLLWGTIGQLPAAALAALAISWASVRLEAVARALEAIETPSRPIWSPARAVASGWSGPAANLLLARICGASLSKRGPPALLLS